MFKHTLFTITLALAGVSLGCDEDVRDEIPGWYVTALQDYENACRPNDPEPAPGSPLLVQIDAVSRTTFDFIFRTEEDLLAVVPDVSVDRHGAWNASYPWRFPNLYNDLTLDFWGNADSETLTATLVWTVLPVPGNGTDPVCFGSVTVSGPRYEGSYGETN